VAVRRREKKMSGEGWRRDKRDPRLGMTCGVH
jgi:hypothetical protein